MPKFSSGIKKKKMNFKQNVHNTWGRKKRCQLKVYNRYGLKLVE